jgi:Uma2 family endonuclease
MTIAAAVSLEDYLSTSYDPDCEYVDGRLLERNMGESDHAGLQGLLIGWLLLRRKELGIHVFPELRVQIAPHRYRVPDITVTTLPTKGRVLTEPPLLCIEILSPEDRASRMEEKIDDYLNFGVGNVWLIDPRNRRAWTFTRESRREASDVLSTAAPKIDLPIFELFSQLDDEVEPSVD